MQLAVKLLAPCTNLTLVVQLLAVLLHGRLKPAIWKPKLPSVPLAWLASDGVKLLTRGNDELEAQH